MAQLLLSCIHSWGIDPNLDETCISRLGMLKPVNAISFGLLTRGRLSLLLPNWKISDTDEIAPSDSEEYESEVVRLILELTVIAPGSWALYDSGDGGW